MFYFDLVFYFLSLTVLPIFLATFSIFSCYLHYIILTYRNNNKNNFAYLDIKSTNLLKNQFARQFHICAHQTYVPAHETGLPARETGLAAHDHHVCAANPDSCAGADISCAANSYSCAAFCRTRAPPRNLRV